MNNQILKIILFLLFFISSTFAGDKYNCAAIAYDETSGTYGWAKSNEMRIAELEARLNCADYLEEGNSSQCRIVASSCDVCLTMVKSNENNSIYGIGLHRAGRDIPKALKWAAAKPQDNIARISLQNAIRFCESKGIEEGTVLSETCNSTLVSLCVGNYEY